MNDESLTVDFKFVAFGFAAKDGMVVENETRFAGTGSGEEERRGEAADAAADNDAIEEFGGVGDGELLAFEFVVANGVVAGGHDLVSVAV